MVTNTSLTLDMITEESLIILKNSLGLGNRCLRQFDESFGNEGAKSGDTLRVRKPVRYQSTTGPAAAAQNFTETMVPVAAQTQRNIVLNFSSKDLALAIDEFSERVLEPAVSQLASDIDTDGTLVATSGYTVVNNGYVTANYAGTYAGFMGLATPGAITGGLAAAWTGADVGTSNLGVAGATPIANAAAPFFQAKARLDEQNSPAGERYCVLSPSAAASLAPNLFTLFNPQQVIGEIFEEGKIGGPFAGAKFFESPSVQTFTSGTWKSNTGANVYVAVVSGDTTLNIGNVGNAAVIVAGDQFVVANVYSVNPQTRQSTSKLQVFTVTALATANSSGSNVGNVTVSIYPAIANSGAYQTVTYLPISGSAVTFMGTPSTSTAANFMYNKNALALVVAPLAVDDDGVKMSRAVSEQDGLSIRYASQFQASTDVYVRRLDILYGWACVRPELGVRIQG